MLERMLSVIVESWLLFVYVSFAKRRNKKEYLYVYIKILCSAGDNNKVTAAMCKIREYDKQIHDDMCGVVKRIVFVESFGCDVLLARGTILISESDQSHLATETNLAGWLLYYYALIRSVKKTGLLRWSEEKQIEARNEGTRMKDNFLRNCNSLAP